MSKIVLVSASSHERYNEFEINGIPIFEIGIGKTNAAARMVEIIINSGCDTVVNFGSCGNLKQHEVGKVMKVGKVINDYETYGFGNEPREIVIDEHSDIKLFTTDSFYQPFENYSTWYNINVNKCDIIDMEGFALAKVCRDFGVDFHSYKWVSDDGDITLWKENAAKGYENFKKLFIEEFLKIKK
jgi:adenosylhomocysteine nucleosidase